MKPKLLWALAALIAATHAATWAELHATYPDPATIPAYLAWCENVKHCSAMRLTYAYDIQWHCAEALRAPSGRRTHLELKVVRSGDTLERYQLQERFDKTTTVWQSLPEDPGQYRLHPESTETEINIHGKEIFYSYNSKFNAGSLWKWWDNRESYPLQITLPPSPSLWKLAQVDETGNTLTLAYSARNFARYYLDPAIGFMPRKIEHFDLQKDGSEFTFRYITLDAYAHTPAGAFLPEKITQHDGRPLEDGTYRDMITTSYTMTAYEEGVNFAPDEFTFSFPPSTRVQDHMRDEVPVIDKY